MKVKFNKYIKKWIIVSDIFERKFREFETKKEAEYFLQNEFGVGLLYNIPNLSFDLDI